MAAVASLEGRAHAGNQWIEQVQTRKRAIAQQLDGPRALVVSGLRGVMEWHFRFGYAVLALLLFRLFWGFAGGRWSRFRAFIYAPLAVMAHVRGRAHPDHLIGHTPLGALSVFALLGVLALHRGSVILQCRIFVISQGINFVS